jgi:glutamine amidotransferase
MIGIIDYGSGNLSSVLNAFKRLDNDVEIFSDSKKTKNYSKLILPGVGSFKAGMDLLNKNKWTSEIKNYVKNGKPLLGICLGMQLLFSKSEEEDINKGLDLISGSVDKMKIEKNLKIPHVGWNNLIIKKKHPLLKDINQEIDFYFVHSYSCNPEQTDDILAEFEYGYKYVACVAKENIFGTQFHPEKSMPAGITLLKNFIDWKV